MKESDSAADLRRQRIIECRNVINNANDVLNSPLQYPTYAQFSVFHIAELNTRTMWGRLKKEAETKLSELQKQ